MSKPKSKMHERLLDASAHREAARRRHVVVEGGDRILPERAEVAREQARAQRDRMTPEERDMRAKRHERLAASMRQNSDAGRSIAAMKARVEAAAQKKRALDAAAAARGEKRELVVSAAFADRMKRAGAELPKGTKIVDPLLVSKTARRARRQVSGG